MGYYSQVGYVIQGKKEEIIPIITTYRLTHPTPANAKATLDECTYSIVGDIMTIKFHADNVKWYEGFEDVDNHTALFGAFREAAEDDGSTINGKFVRVGEDDLDLTTSSYGADPYDLVRPVRTIEFEVLAEDSLEDVLK